MSTYSETTNAEVFALTRQRRAESALRARLALVAKHGPTRYHSFTDFAQAMPPPPKRPAQSMRAKAIERSRQRRALRCNRLMRAQSGLCYLCAEPFGECRPPTLEHVMPRASGGRTSGNVLLACGPCNNAKGSRMPTARESVILRLVNKALAMMGD